MEEVFDNLPAFVDAFRAKYMANKKTKKGEKRLREVLQEKKQELWEFRPSAGVASYGGRTSGGRHASPVEVIAGKRAALVDDIEKLEKKLQDLKKLDDFFCCHCVGGWDISLERSYLDGESFEAIRAELMREHAEWEKEGDLLYRPSVPSVAEIRYDVLSNIIGAGYFVYGMRLNN